MPDELGFAIAALRKKLAEQHRMVADTKRSINLLLKMDGQNPEYAEDDDPSSSAVRADQFYGKGLATSAAEYLAIRREAVQPAEILRALEAGGFDFDMLPWKKDDRLRSFALSLAKNAGNAGKFHRLKNGSFGLRSWYDEDFLKKVKAGADASAKAKTKKRGRPPKIEKAQTGSVVQSIKKQRGRPRKTGLVKGPRLLPEGKGRPAADRTIQKEAVS
jgi:hypothetical protein